jgi:hypothetical protein
MEGWHWNGTLRKSIWGCRLDSSGKIRTNNVLVWARQWTSRFLQNPSILLISWLISSLSGRSLLRGVQLFISSHLLGSSCRQLNELKLARSRDNSVGMAMGYILDGLGLIPAMQKRFLSSQRPDWPLRPVQLAIKWVPRAVSSVVMRPEREAGHTPPRAAIKQGWWSYTSSPSYVLMAWCLVI